MAWDDEGSLLATASKKGTVVRVHAVSAPCGALHAVVPRWAAAGPAAGAVEQHTARPWRAAPAAALQVRRSEERALEFRRGSTPAAITCLAFSPPGVVPRLLCCTSDHGTAHIFRLDSLGRCGGVLLSVLRQEGLQGCMLGVSGNGRHPIILACTHPSPLPVNRHPAAAAAKSLLLSVIPPV